MAGHSIREPVHSEPVLVHARKAHAVVFEDVFTPEGTHGHGPKPAHLQGVLRYVAQSGREPLVFQCWADRSRSAAVALVVIVKMLWDQGIDGPELVRRAAESLLAIRPLAIPNHLVLRLGLEERIQRNFVD